MYKSTDNKNVRQKFSRRFSSYIFVTPGLWYAYWIIARYHCTAVIVVFRMYEVGSSGSTTGWSPNLLRPTCKKWQICGSEVSQYIKRGTKTANIQSSMVIFFSYLFLQGSVLCWYVSSKYLYFVLAQPLEAKNWQSTTITNQLSSNTINIEITYYPCVLFVFWMTKNHFLDPWEGLSLVQKVECRK